MESSAKPTAIDWARLAAYIDGEGYIRICSPNAKYRNSAMKLSIANTDFRLLVWLQDTFGGKIARSTGNDKKRTRELWRWDVNNAVAADILKECLPYFIMKRDQAEIAIAYREMIDRQKAGQKLGRGYRVSEQDYAERTAYAEMLKSSRLVSIERKRA